jgi:hypothetical protein
MVTDCETKSLPLHMIKSYIICHLGPPKISTKAQNAAIISCGTPLQGSKRSIASLCSEKVQIRRITFKFGENGAGGSS